MIFIIFDRLVAALERCIETKTLVRRATPQGRPAAARMARSNVPRSRSATVSVRAAIELDFSDPDTIIGIAGAVLGVVAGIGAPILYMTAAGELAVFLHHSK